MRYDDSDNIGNCKYTKIEVKARDTRFRNRRSHCSRTYSLSARLDRVASRQNVFLLFYSCCYAPSHPVASRLILHHLVGSVRSKHLSTHPHIEPYPTDPSLHRPVPYQSIAFRPIPPCTALLGHVLSRVACHLAPSRVVPSRLSRFVPFHPLPFRFISFRPVSSRLAPSRPGSTHLITHSMWRQ